MVPSMVNDIYIIRFAVCAKYANDDDMHIAFNIIQEHADSVLAEYRSNRTGRKSVSNDSLDSTTKQIITTNNTEHEVTISKEIIDSETVAKTSASSAITLGTKSQVKK